MGISYNPSIVTDGLVLCLDAANRRSYPGVGTTWTDLSGNGNNGTLTNGPTFSAANGGSVVFDGTNDSVRLPSLGNFGSNPISYEWIVKSVPNGNFQNLFYNGDDTYSHIYIMNNGNIRYYNNAAYDTNNLSINTNVFKSIVITKNTTSVLIYINGIYRSSLTTGSTTGNFYTPIIGFTNANLYPLNGNISIFRLYNRILSASEIRQNYNATKGRYL